MTQANFKSSKRVSYKTYEQRSSLRKHHLHSSNRKSTSSLYVSNSVLDQIGINIYDTQLDISNNLEAAFSNPSLFGCGMLLLAGILSSLSPCSLSMIPLTTLYLGGDNDNSIEEVDIKTKISSSNIDKSSSSSSSESEPNLFYSKNLNRNSNSSTISKESTSQNRLLKSFLYSGGLAFTFTVLGLIASLTGQFITASDSTTGGGNAVFSIKDLSSLVTAAFTVIMGLNVLEIIPFTFTNTIDFASKRRQLNLPWQIEPFAFGATAALVLSTCSSPVLASLLALVSNSHNPTLGTLYLFFYSLGYSSPTVLAVNTSLNFAKSLLSSSASSQWVNTLFGSLLITFGTYFALDSTSKIFLGS